MSCSYMSIDKTKILILTIIMWVITNKSLPWKTQFGWLVVLGLNGSLRQHLSLYQAFSHREGKRRAMIDES